MRIVGNNPQLSRQTQATASGAITGGKPVVVNTDGTVTEISATAGAIGTPVAFESAATNYIDSVYEQNAQRVVIAYVDEGNSNYGTATVATVNSSDNSISYITPVVFHSGTTKYVSTSSYINKVLIAYQDDGDGDKGKAVIGYNTSSSNISFGSDVEFEGGTTEWISSAWDTNSNKSVIAYKDAGNSNYGTAVVATPSGATGVSFGTPVVFESANTTHTATVYDSSNTKIVIAYRDVGNSGHGTAIVGTVSGTSISFGSAVVFESAAVSYVEAAFDSNSNKVVIVYQDAGNSSYGTAIVGTVSSTSISFGTAVVFESANVNELKATFDSNDNRVIIAYTDTGNSSYGTVIEGTVSGTSISFSSPVVYESASNIGTKGISFDAGVNRTVIAYGDEGNSNYGTGVVYATETPTNITSENFIGFAQDTVATGQPVTINTKGAIADNMPQLVQTVGYGSVVQFDAGNLSSENASSLAFDSNSNKVVLAYKDNGNSNYGTALVGTIDTSDNSISWGSAVIFESAATDEIATAFDSNSNKVVIAYKDSGNSGQGTALVGTVSGTSISFGSTVTFNNGGTTDNTTATFDSSNNKVVITYQDGGNSNYGTAVVGTVSGTSISFGSEVVFNSGNSVQQSGTFDTSNNKFVIAYLNIPQSRGEARVGTVSGTDISFGSATTYNNASTLYNSATFDTSNNKVVIAYQDAGNSSAGTAIVGTVSGTSISFGSEATFNGSTAFIGITFDSTNNKSLIAYRDNADNNNGTIIEGTVSGTSISFGSENKYTTGGSVNTYNNRITYDSNAKRAVVIYTEGGASGRGDSRVFRPAANVDLTIGQQYFVQTDGTLSQTADSPSVTAGTAVAGSTLIVKG